MMSSNKATKIIFYWDYDGEFGGERSVGNPRRGVGYEDYEATKRIIDILDEYDIKAVFAFVGAVGNKGPLPYFASDIVKEVSYRGHEVASHGWEHEWIPSLTRLRLKKILEWSKKTLEDVTGREIISFVPPWNAPTRYLKKLSFGLWEFRRSIYNRIDLPVLCEVLKEVGYKTTRSRYEPLQHTLLRWIIRDIRRFNFYNTLKVKDILLIPPNTPGGFGDESLKILDSVIKNKKKLCVFWAHPHSLLYPGKQSENNLRKLLEKVREYKKMGKVDVVLPRHLI